VDFITNSQHRDFLKLWIGQTVSAIGSRITRDGIPLTAVLVLNAQPSQMSYLVAVEASAVLLFGLMAGVWVDRMRRRPIMISTDLARATLLLSIPALAVAHRLSMVHLYLVIALTGICTVFFDVAYQTYVPSLVERENLLGANSKIAMSNALAEIAGPSLTGILVQLITAPIAILIDAASFVCSAFSISLIRRPETAGPVDGGHPVVHELFSGMRFVMSHPLLRPLAMFSMTAYFFMGFLGPLYVLFAIRDLHLTPAALGVAIAMGGAGNMLGATRAPRISRRLGLGPAFILSVLSIGCAFTLIPLAHGSVALAFAFLAVSQVIGDMAFVLFMVNELTLRQSVAPEEILGRVNGAMQLLTRGILPFGALAGGLLAGMVTVRSTLFIGTTGVLLASIWLIASPIRRTR
jgi:predicted MFS family arabinose efflux permease